MSSHVGIHTSVADNTCLKKSVCKCGVSVCKCMSVGRESEFRSREEIVQIGVALASRGLSVDLCVRVLVDGGLGGLMEDMVRVGLVARLTRLALGDDVRPLHAAAADIAGGAGPDAVI